MFTTTTDTNLVKNTSYKVVLPFYVYAAISLLTAAVLLFNATNDFTGNYFNPHILAITHTMALGWGTMIILGASHQLVPVLIETQLFSDLLAYISFACAAIGIPLLVYAFFTFQLNTIAITGAALINTAIISFLVNIFITITKSKNENIHAVYVLTAAIWLFFTTSLGLLLLINFTHTILRADSVHYLSLHAHMGIIGWFLLLVIGVGSRLIPMFLISKYNNPKQLKIIYFLINGALASFIILFFFHTWPVWYLLPAAVILISLVLFGRYCQTAYKQRIRKKVDDQMKISLLSVSMMALPVLLLISLIILLPFSSSNTKLALAYGFFIFFGWITAIILGMTFKTLPFIVWNKQYHNKAGLGKTPNPKDLFSASVFKIMEWSYLCGFILFALGILLVSTIILQIAAALLILTAVMYNWNIMKMLMHKPLIK